MPDVNQILTAIEDGDGEAAESLLPAVYAELRKLAAQRLTRESPSISLDATDLVHEAFLRLRGKDGERQWDGPAHFFAAAADEMRRILIDRARRKSRVKHGGDRQRVDLDAVDVSLGNRPVRELLLLDEALRELEQADPEKAQVVKLHYFAGLTLEETGAVLNISRATTSRYYAFARAWLSDKMRQSDDSLSM